MLWTFTLLLIQISSFFCENKILKEIFCKEENLIKAFKWIGLQKKYFVFDFGFREKVIQKLTYTCAINYYSLKSDRPLKSWMKTLEFFFRLPFHYMFWRLITSDECMQAEVKKWLKNMTSDDVKNIALKISDVILSCMTWKNAMKAEQYY